MSEYTLTEKLQLASWYYVDKIKRNLKLSDPKAWNSGLWNLYGRSKTESGVDVNEENYNNYSAVYAAINIISSDISSLPIHLYKRGANGKRKLISDHPSLQRLKYRANPFIPAINFRQATMAHLLAWGNLYAEIVRNTVGDIMELWPITPDRVNPKHEKGTIVYYVRVGNVDVPMARENIMHIAGLGHNGIMGYSVIRKAAESIGLSLGAEKFGARYFGANTNIGGAIKHPRALGDEGYKNLKRSMADYTGSDSSHRWMILENGLEIEKLGFSPDESQFLQTRQFQVGEVARWFNMPPHKLKDLTRSTFSNIEEQEIEYVTSCLVPWLAKLEHNYDINLLSEKQQKTGYYFKHNVTGLLRGNMAARGAFYTQQFYLGALTPNEIRELEDRDALDTDNADKAYIQMNLIPLDDIDKQMAEPEPEKKIPGDQPPEPDEPEVNNIEWSRGKVRLLEYRNIIARDRISKRYHPMIKQAAGRVVWKEQFLLDKIFKTKKSVRANAKNIKSEIDTIYESYKSYVVKVMGPVFRAFADSIFNQALLEIGETVDEMSDDMKLEIERYIETFALRHTLSSAGQLKRIIDDNIDEDFKALVLERVEEWQETRATKIANNETVRMASFVAQAGFFSYGYSSYWRIRGAETCPYCQSLNGKSVSKGQTFFDGGEEHDPKGATSGPMLIRGTVMHPPLHQGCDCYISVR